MPIIGPKTSIMSKHITKKSIGYSFFFFRFSPKNQYSHPHILLKRQFSKTTMLSCPYFIKKTFILPKQNALMSFFLSFHHKPPAFKHIIFVDLVRKRHFCQTNVYIMGHKSQQKAPFSNFSRKNQCPYAHILLRKVHAPKNTMLLCPFFVKKRSFSKTR